MLNFLKQYPQAIDLDEEHFDLYFPQGRQRSDFLLFDETTICEFKDLCKFDVKKRVEHVARKEFTTENNLKRDLYNTIEKNLSKANKQIKETKKALDKPNAIGLIIIENHIPHDISVLSLLDAAERKMKNGLDSTDGILCLDFINTIINNEGFRSHLTQLVFPVEEETEKTKELYSLVEKLMEDFCNNRGSAIYSGHDTQELEQHWSVDADGKYKKYNGNIKVNLDQEKS